MKKEVRRIIRQTGTVFFLLYVLLLMYVLFFSEVYGRGAEHMYRYNLIPFLEIRRFWMYREQLGMLAFYTNVLGNVLAFLPYGFLLPVAFSGVNSSLFTTLSGLSVSLCVETIQLITRVGSFDVDDLILNTLGAALGYFLFRACNHLRRISYGKKI